MKTWTKLRRRFGKTATIQMSENTFAMALQMGWAEKYLGAYILTDKGYDEIRILLKDMP